MYKFQVVGNPVAHSLSPDIHAAFAAQLGHQISYDKAEVALRGFADHVDAFRASGGHGLNVTLPFKEDAFRYVDEMDALAAQAKAVNTIHIHDGRTLGFNTDGVGLVQDLEVRHQVSLAGTKVLLLGAGGATRGVVLPLLNAGVARLTIANRTETKAFALAREFKRQGDVVACGLPVAGRERLLEERQDIVINATSLDQGVDIAEVLISAKCVEETVCYDMGYGARARFAQWAGDRADKAVDGLGMLVEQAAESYAIWLGSRPDTADIYKVLAQRLAVT